MKSLSKRVNESQTKMLEAELSELQKEYQAYFNELLSKYDVKSPSALSDEQKTEFFKEVKSGWVKGQGRKTNESLILEGKDDSKKVKMSLVGVDGNAFAIMGTFQKNARRQGWKPDEIKKVIDECMSGDYNHLLQTIMKNIE